MKNPMKKILIPTDFSANALNAIQYALQFFKEEHCTFYVLHVSQSIADPATTSMGFASINAAMMQEAIATDHKKLCKLIKTLRQENNNIDHHFVSLQEYTFFTEAVKNQVTDKDIDYIVMGTKGASGFKEAVIGSNTADVITKVKCPVLIVPEKAKYQAPGEVAFPTDYNLIYTPELLRRLTEILALHKAELRILNIQKNNEDLAPFQKANQETLDLLLKDHQHSFHTITHSNIEAAMQSFIEYKKIDLVVMVAKNLNFLQRLLFEPLVEKISYHTQIPFLVLHER